MSVLVIGDDERDAIEQATARARANPMPFDVLQSIAADVSSSTPHLQLADRKQGVAAARAKYPSQHVTLGTYDAAISFEWQHDTLARHLSVSSATKGMLPGPEVFAMILKAFGFSGFPPTRPYQVWIEEFEPGHNAINLVEMVDVPPPQDEVAG
jgi:hypothetical protein